MAQQTINSGNPPIVWSIVDEAFTKINANFDELYASIGGVGGSINFTSLSSNLIPSANESYDLGSATYRWRDLYLSGSSLYIGSAQITSDITGAIHLPAGSTVGNELIINPTYTGFKNIEVSGQSTIVADQYADTITLAAGNAGITLTTNAGTDTLTITNNGILNVAGTAGQIGVSLASGTATLTNLGVLSLTGETGGIGVSASTGSVTITNLGVKRIIAGAGINISPVGGTGTITIENIAPASPTFRTIQVDNDTGNLVQADPGVYNDTLYLVSGAGITITPNSSTDTLTFSVNSNLDIKGSVFGADSSVIIDSINNSLTVSSSVIGSIEIFGSTISTSNSSGINVDVSTVFNTDVTIENDLTVNGLINGYISLLTLKDIVASSVDFIDFKTKVAALS